MSGLLVLCRHGWEGAVLGCHEWVQGLSTTFHQAQASERQGRQEQVFNTGDSQQTLMGTVVTKALHVSLFVVINLECY